MHTTSLQGTLGTLRSHRSSAFRSIHGNSYTESDWELWTAAICAPATRRLFVNAVAYWLNNTSTDRAFTDLYETIDDGSYPASPDSIHFIARPVAGGHFSLLALLKSRPECGYGGGFE